MHFAELANKNFERTHQSEPFERGGMQLMRHPMNVTADGLYVVGEFLDLYVDIAVCGIFQQVKLDRQKREPLGEIVMEFACETRTFGFPSAYQTTPELMYGLLGILQVGDVGRSSKNPRWFPVCVLKLASRSDPSLLAVGPNDAVLQRISAGRPGDVLDPLVEYRTVVGVYAGAEFRYGDRLVRAEPEDLAPRIVCPHCLAIPLADPNSHVSGGRCYFERTESRAGYLLFVFELIKQLLGAGGINAQLVAHGKREANKDRAHGQWKLNNPPEHQYRIEQTTADKKYGAAAYPESQFSVA